MEGPTGKPRIYYFLAAIFSKKSLFSRYDFPVRYLPQTEMIPIYFDGKLFKNSLA